MGAGSLDASGDGDGPIRAGAPAAVADGPPGEQRRQQEQREQQLTRRAALASEEAIESSEEAIEAEAGRVDVDGIADVGGEGDGIVTLKMPVRGQAGVA